MPFSNDSINALDDCVYSVAFSPDSKQLAIGGDFNVDAPYLAIYSTTR